MGDRKGVGRAPDRGRAGIARRGVPGRLLPGASAREAGERVSGPADTGALPGEIERHVEARRKELEDA